MKLLKLIFYFAGVFLIGGLVHELYHVWDCGGFKVADFIVGVLWNWGSLSIEKTWCNTGAHLGEVIPTILELSVWLLAVIYRP